MPTSVECATQLEVRRQVHASESILARSYDYPKQYSNEKPSPRFYLNSQVRVSTQDRDSTLLAKKMFSHDRVYKELAKSVLLAKFAILSYGQRPRF